MLGSHLPLMREVVLVLLLVLQWIQSVAPLPLLCHLVRPSCVRAGSGSPCSSSALRLQSDQKALTGSSTKACEAHCAHMEAELSARIKQLCGDSAHILLCVSGGSDSMALLHLLQRVREQRPALALRVVNFNHKARPESDEEAVFVRTWAESYALPFYTCELPQHMRQSVGFQERARTWRREESLRILQEWSQEVRGYPDPGGANIPSDRSEGAGSVPILPFYIATAHIHEDQLETLLLKLLRGVHIANIHGMDALDEHFLKPLLGVGKEHLQRYLQCRGLAWREDASNQSRKYKRNAVRLDLLPLMAELAGGAGALANRLEQLSAQSGDVRELLQMELPRWRNRLIYTDSSSAPSELAVAEEVLTSMPALILSELLREWVLDRAGESLTYQQLSRVADLLRTPLPLGKASKAVTISKGWDIERSGCRLRLKMRPPGAGGRSP